MRVPVSRAVRRTLTAGAVLVALFVGGCADSPTDQLSRAENLLADLTSKGAEAYLKYELAGARQRLEEARQFIRKNRFEAAGQYLNRVCQTLDSCNVAFLQQRTVAEQKCQEEMADLSRNLETMRSRMTTLPRQSYIDQNRYDIYTHRLRRYLDEMDILQKLFAQQDFNTALQRSFRLGFQVNQSLTGLASATPIPERAPKASTTLEGDAALAVPFMAASNSTHSGGH
ncbi:MAG: hypothetical protein ALAOOOJD_00975 [bacterium]|nr:hypothetical protein [bacterium]